MQGLRTMHVPAAIIVSATPIDRHDEAMIAPVLNPMFAPVLARKQLLAI